VPAEILSWWRAARSGHRCCSPLCLLAGQRLLRETGALGVQEEVLLQCAVHPNGPYDPRALVLHTWKRPVSELPKK